MEQGKLTGHHRKGKHLTKEERVKPKYGNNADQGDQ